MESILDSIKVLPETINKNGFIYILVTRTPQKALYMQTLDGILIGYEVFLIGIRGAQNSSLLGKLINATERFPSNENFGKTAWSFMDLQNALHKYNEL